MGAIIIVPDHQKIASSAPAVALEIAENDLIYGVWEGYTW